MKEKTIREISDEAHISRFTLAQVAREGRFGNAARQSGVTWLIDTEAEQFKQWLKAHWQQPRVKKRKKKEF
jgi:hypothetical protein